MTPTLRHAWQEELLAWLGPERLAFDVSLGALTTFRVGGAADCLADVRGRDALVGALRIARIAGVPVTLLGGGSNVLVGDKGVRGLVVRVRGGAIERCAADIVRAEAGVTINEVVRWTITRGLSGLEAWAGTPGTVGGAIFGNAHFDGRLIGELLVNAELVTLDGQLTRVPASDMEFGYDDSRLRRTGETLVSAEFRVTPDGSPMELRRVARRSLAFRKRTQPLDTPSAGCIFQNPDPARDAIPAGVPASAGALIDRAGLKGRSIGGACVSATHGNFIVNTGSATATEIRDLVRLCRDEVERRFGIRLREEIVYVGEF